MFALSMANNSHKESAFLIAKDIQPVVFVHSLAHLNADVNEILVKRGVAVDTE